jgi:hypothetical protein
MQAPRPPIWVAGRWPNKAPFRRAARFDGVMPTHVDHGHDSFMSADDIREVVEYVADHRASGLPFDVVMEGMSHDSDDLTRRSSAYGSAGVTWWIEKLGWWRGAPDVALARVNDGPPDR